MLFDKFVKETGSFWSSYLNRMAELQKRGNLDSKNGVVLYPNILIVNEFYGFFVAELIGARKEYGGMTIKRHKEKSIYRYLSQFDDDMSAPAMHLNGSQIGFRFLCIAQEADFEEVKKRFPFIELFPTKLNRTGGKGNVFSFGGNFSSCFVENSVLVNRKENIFRCKNILELIIVKKNITKNELRRLFEHMTEGNSVKGVHTVSKEKEESLIIGGHLQSMYLTPGMSEPTIGEYIKSHPEIVKGAFKTKHFEYEPFLEWIEHDGTVKDTAINPDLLVQREDGFYDIYDLKTAVLSRKKLIKGERKRRRFIDYVEEGVAQLANYREYFQHTKNKDLAKRKYGIEIHNPGLVLIVGSWENAPKEEIDQACRRYKDIAIIDFDTLIHLFIGAEETTISNTAGS